MIKKSGEVAVQPEGSQHDFIIQTVFTDVMNDVTKKIGTFKQEMIFNSKDETSISRFIQSLSETVRKYYGEVEISLEFCSTRPSIIFLPISIKNFMNEAQTTDQSEDDRLRENILNTFHFQTKDITSPDILESILTDVVRLRTAENGDKIDLIITNAVISYLRNMELYRLTKNQNGTLIRWAKMDENGKTPVDDADVPMDGRVKRLSYLKYANEKIQALGAYRVITYWSRYDKRKVGYRIGTSPIFKVLSDAENSHFVALDPAQDGALILLAK